MSVLSKIIAERLGTESASAMNNHNANAGEFEILMAQCDEIDIELAHGSEEAANEQRMDSYLIDSGERIEAAIALIANITGSDVLKPALSTQSLMVLNTTLLKHVGIHATGLESASTIGPVQATEEVMLGCEASLSEIGDSLVKGFYAFLDWCTKQFNKMFGKLERLGKAAKALKEKESKIDGTLSKDQISVDLASLVTGANGKNLEGDIAKGIDDLINLSTNLVATVEDKAELVVEAVSDSLEKSATDWGAGGSTSSGGSGGGTGSGGGSGDNPSPAGGGDQTSSFNIGDEDNSADPAAMNGVNDAINDVVTAAKAVTGTDTTGKEILGGRTIKALDDSAKGLKKAKIELSSPTKTIEKKDLRPMDVKDVAKVCDSVIDGCIALITSRKKMGDTKVLKTKFSKVVKSAGSLAKDSDYKGAGASIRLVANIARDAGTMSVGDARMKLVSVTTRVMSAALKFANASLRKEAS